MIRGSSGIPLIRVPCAEGMSPVNHGSPIGHADRIRDVPAIEDAAVSGQPVQMRCGDLPVAAESEVFRRLLIDTDDQLAQ